MTQRPWSSRLLAEAAPELELVLMGGVATPAQFAVSEITRSTFRVAMRDGVCLVTDLYLPPTDRPVPAIALRTPYGRARLADTLVKFQCCGYAVVAQDTRGTGDSDPDTWDYYVYEREDSCDFVEWIAAQAWFDGFLGGCGGSYLAQTQWCMALHPRMSVIAPEVGGLGVASHTARLYMFLNAYARTVGKGTDKAGVGYDEIEREMVQETLAGGYFNEPLHRPFPDELLKRYPALRELASVQAKKWLWGHYTALPAQQRAELILQALDIANVTITSIEALPSLFGQEIAHDAHIFASPDPSTLCRSVHAPALMITGWYDWGLNDALATWQLLMQEAPEHVRLGSRLLITPASHNAPGCHEGHEQHPELTRSFRTADIPDLLLRWYGENRADNLAAWPKVIYYLMGANEWCVSSAWPPPEAKLLALRLGPRGTLTLDLPPECAPDTYIYDPTQPTPTLGGSIVSYVYRPGSVDVSEAQRRPDVLTYTTEILEGDLDVVGPLTLVLFASSSAVDTDFSARLSDVHRDGRVIQVQSGLLRARYRNSLQEPELIDPGRIYRLEIDMWSTANRFKAGHRLRIDVSSADFPRFDRNTNLGGMRGDPVSALQTIYHDPERPSHLLVSVLGYGMQ